MTGFEGFERKMRAEGLPALAIETFRYYYEQLVSGETGLLAEADIESVSELPELGALPEVRGDVGSLLERAVVIKLNGGLATSMGMTEPKSLLAAKDGHSFLDLIVRQILWLRDAHACRLPLLLMNSFRTREPSLAALAKTPAIDIGLPLDFVQHKVPRITADDLAPAAWPDEPAYEWCPPGHGDIYTALVTSGLLLDLRSRGIRYAMVSNIDNLGATLDLRILQWMQREEVPFLMEVTRRLLADRKGGHLASRQSDGQLVLRESAQCAAADVDAFRDVGRHPYFNTNNIWLDLEALAAVLDTRSGILGLPLIRNDKHLDPERADSPAVIQLETAMGAAIGVFEGARALAVPRHRFAPVKTTNDLLALWSDVYELCDDWRVVRSERAPADQMIDLDPVYFKNVADFTARVPADAPSLLGCRSLTVRGDVRFGRKLVFRGDVALAQEGPEPRRLPDGAEFEG